MTKEEFVELLINSVMELNPDSDEYEVIERAIVLSDQAEENAYSFEANFLILGSQILQNVSC